MRWLLAAALMVCAVEAQERFPKPEPERAFAELKVMDPGGSPLRRPREDWQGARERVMEAEWRPWLSARRADVDGWMAQRQDRVEWVAGWWHDFVNAKDGGFLEWSPEAPKDAKPKVFGGWVFGFRSRHGDKTLEAARLWRLTGERGYGEWSAAQLDFYADNYEKWPVQTSKSKSRLMHQSLDDAVMLVRLVRAATALEGFAGAERKKQWYERLFRPMALLLDETFQRVHNIACWHRSAMGMAALYGQDEELWRRAVDGPFGLRTQMREGVTSDWLWLEQSLLYNSYVVSALLPVFEAASMAGRGAELRQEMAVAENLMLGPSSLRFATGKLPTPADSTAGFRTWPEMGILLAARRVFPTVPGVRAAAEEKGWETLLDPPERVAGRGVPEVGSRNLESSRMAVLRRGPWQVYFHYGQLDASHAQAEALNYEVFYGATDVSHDAGTVGYGSPLHKELFQTAAAHNVPVVDGLGQTRWNPGELVSFSGEAVAARQPAYRPGVSAERRLALDGERLVDTVKVSTSDGAEHRLGLIVQVQGKAELGEGFAADSVAAFPHWGVGRSVKAGSVVSLVVRYGELRMRLRVEAKAPMKVTHAVTPDSPPGQRESLYFEVIAREAEFTTVWQVEAAVAEERLRNGVEFTW